MNDSKYIGNELELFAKAFVWKSYLRRQIAPFLGARVLEVGAGIGGTTAVFCDGSQATWTCLEPDPELAEQLQAKVAAGELPACCQMKVGTVSDVSQSAYDTLLYIDVLEHIENDAAELKRALACLVPGGRLVVLSPAHQFLYTPFDKAIGHFRRYSKKTLSAVGPPGAKLIRLRYLDAVGLLASAGNRLVLNSSQPTASQIAFWDGVLVRMSKLLDPVTMYLLGKSVFAVWQREGE